MIRGDAGESDYDLLSGLPDEVAMAALTGLTETDNQPIGEEQSDDAGRGDYVGRAQFGFAGKSHDRCASTAFGFRFRRRAAFCTFVFVADVDDRRVRVVRADVLARKRNRSRKR